MEAKKEKHQSIGNIRAQSQNYRCMDLNNFKISLKLNVIYTLIINLQY